MLSLGSTPRGLPKDIIMKDDQTTPLKPCPFCGSKAEYVVTNQPYPHRVQCTNEPCGATAGGSAFRNDAYNASKWNNRV